MRTLFDFKLETSQLITAAGRNAQRMIRGLEHGRMLSILSGVILATAFLIPLDALILSEHDHLTQVRPIWIAALLLIAASILAAALDRRTLDWAWKQSTWFTTPSQLAIEETGLRIINAHSNAFFAWAAIAGVEEVGDVILLLLDNIHFVPIPTSAFATQEEKAAFLAHIQKTGADARTSDFTPANSFNNSWIPPHEAERLIPARGRITSALGTFLVSLGQAFKLLFFFNVAETNIRLSWWQIPAFGLFNVFVMLVSNIASVGVAGQFVWYSLPLAVFHIPVLVLGAIFIAQALRRPPKTVLLIQIFLMIMLGFDLATWAISLWLPIQPLTFTQPALGISYFFLPALWLALACLKAAYYYAGAKVSARVIAFALALVLVALPLGLVYRQGSLWEIPYNENTAGKANYGLETEALFYSQQYQLERELAALQKERKGVRELFFVGVAGYADQDVFVKEVDSVARLFRERFDADGHIVRLVNNNKTLASAPIASATNLKITLNRVAQVMDKEEDILFLFLTSHGSQSQFSLQLWPLKLNQLEPVQLRKMLDEAGIKNRVVVVSSCYSGSFIKPLSDDHTLVISAAAADKTSFGCSNENEWTYFGDAYFNHALRKTRSFSEAFNLAKSQIGAREKKEKIDPSDPQMAIGASMRNTLASLEQEWGTPKTSGNVKTDLTTIDVPDSIDRYINLLFTPETLGLQTQACIASMAMHGPETVIQKNPEYFSGLNKSSAQWPLLMAAWDRYATRYCEQSNDLNLERDLYRKYLRKNVAPADLIPAIEFLNSESGHRWYTASHLVARQMSIELTEIQTAIEIPLSKVYFDEQSQIIKAYQIENQRDKLVKPAKSP